MVRRPLRWAQGKAVISQRAEMAQRVIARLHYITYRGAGGGRVRI